MRDTQRQRIRWMYMGAVLFSIGLPLTQLLLSLFHLHIPTAIYIALIAVGWLTLLISGIAYSRRPVNIYNQPLAPDASSEERARALLFSLLDTVQQRQYMRSTHFAARAASGRYWILGTAFQYYWENGSMRAICVHPQYITYADNMVTILLLLRTPEGEQQILSVGVPHWGRHPHYGIDIAFISMIKELGDNA